MPERFSSSSVHQLSARGGDRRYFVWFALFATALVFTGFSRTYFLHRFFHTPDLSRFMHIHAAVMTGWIVLFAVQTFLIKWHRTALHRSMGYFGAGYAVLVVIMGCSATFLSARREVRAQSAEAPFYITVLALELTQMLLFACLVTLAVSYKDRGAYHKRFMVLATLCMLPNPMVRLLILVGVVHNITMIGIWALIVALVVVTDAVRTRSVHLAFATGAPAIVAFLYGAYFVSVTTFWQQFASRAVR